MPYKVDIPKSLPLPIPFTIKQNSFYGIHLKYWVLIAIPATILSLISLYPLVSGLNFLILLLPAFGGIGLLLWVFLSRKKTSLTVSADAITYTKNGIAQVLQFADLSTVEWGLMLAGAKFYYVLYIKNKAGDINWKLSVLNFWNTRELRTVYTSVPAQYQGRQDVQPI
jgi:hypothetical protein